MQCHTDAATDTASSPSLSPRTLEREHNLASMYCSTMTAVAVYAVQMAVVSWQSESAPVLMSTVNVFEKKGGWTTRLVYVHPSSINI